MKKIVVHTCCAPCSAPSVERLMLDEFEVTLYFTNSNIYPKEEYDKRLKAIYKFSKTVDVVVEEDSYDHDIWLEKIRGLEDEPEKGARCAKCFDYSLSRTAEISKRLNIENFTTTLTLGPHKVSKMIFEIGKKYPGYLPFDFKKKGGFLRSIKLSDEYGLYRQNYCGCEFSLFSCSTEPCTNG